jgi:hypothetical protein
MNDTYSLAEARVELAAAKAELRKEKREHWRLQLMRAFPVWKIIIAVRLIVMLWQDGRLGR